MEQITAIALATSNLGKHFFTFNDYFIGCLTVIGISGILSLLINAIGESLTSLNIEAESTFEKFYKKNPKINVRDIKSFAEFINKLAHRSQDLRERSFEALNDFFSNSFILIVISLTGILMGWLGKFFNNIFKEPDKSLKIQDRLYYDIGYISFDLLLVFIQSAVILVSIFYIYKILGIRSLLREYSSFVDDSRKEMSTSMNKAANQRAFVNSYKELSRKL